ncbi:hypothetical protein [Kitasatospora cineracea]|uniref:hypothetical protein n=1 Tax=Kitasatospora cineracea TaxID=88074 RepID=UPI00369F3565
MKHPTATASGRRRHQTVTLLQRLDAIARVAAAPVPRWEILPGGPIGLRAHFSEDEGGIVALNTWRSVLGRAAQISSRRTATGVEWTLVLHADGVTVALSAHAARRTAAPAAPRTAVAV